MIKKNCFIVFKKNLTQVLCRNFLKINKQIEHDLIFIRHAESQFNTACQNYRRLHKIPYVWKELCNHQGFDQKVLFNSKFIDCSITNKGRLECISQRKNIDKLKIDCVLVSPQLRTLQTCTQILKNKKIPFFVEPLLIGPIRSCSDICKPMTSKKNLFPHISFQNPQLQKQLWYLDYLPEDQQIFCQEQFKRKNLFTQKERRLQLLNLLKEEKIKQDAIQYRKRIENLKQRILEYKERFNNIAIVSHYYTIQYMAAKEYMECGSPVCYMDIKNCLPYFSSSKQILKNERMHQSFI